MFKPELKDTGWGEVEETVFEITGENYTESFFPNSKYTRLEKELATTINDSLMDIVWDTTTVSELENYFSEAISESNLDIIKFRIEGGENCIYGWVHYRYEKRINTFRFKIDLKGEFAKC